MKPLLFVLAFAPGCLLAELAVPQFFSDHMVLQRERPAAIWGKADANAEVTLSFKGKTATTKAASDGNWRATIETGKADAKGATLIIQSAGKKIAIQDVLVGEVWFASGQSNMQFSMQSTQSYESLIQESNHPALRMFNASLSAAREPQDDIAGKWTAASPETIPGYSAAAFFFARKLHLELGIPVAVIHSSWGGKPVETFISREALNTLPGTKALLDAAIKADAEFDADKAKADYEKQLAQWQAMRDDNNKKPADQRRPLPKPPVRPKPALETEGKPGVLYNAMIHPFVGYTMRGAIWYQGEANASFNAVPYDQTLPLMIHDWRKRWADDFSFYYVQLANFKAPSTAPGTPDGWALLQNRMRLILNTTPKTGMAVVNDVGDAKDIHPKNKKDPGERLALWALAKDYDKDILYSGPLYQKHEVVKDAIRVTFAHAGDGLKSRDGGPLKRFEIAGADKVWHWAEAKIDGKDAVLLSSPQVKQPVATRYAWASNPEGANLVNGIGLPTSVFRTDDWQEMAVTAKPPASAASKERQALAAEIRALNVKRASLDKASAEYKELTKKINLLMTKFKEGAPKQ
jgi:sialate O-acetylesterase